MTWTILIIKKPHNGWYINYIETKLLNQIEKFKLQQFINVLIYEPNLKFYSDYVSVIDDEIEVSDNFINIVYDKIKNGSDCIGLKGIIYVNENPLKFNNISKNENEICLPLTKLNPIKTEIIFSKINNIAYYTNSENLSNITNNIDTVDIPVMFLEKTVNIPISIIVTAYQTQDYIEECLDSIENQTYFKNNDNFEVLVGVDDCQDTYNKLQEIRHKYRNLYIYMMSENKGTYITTNTLINLVKNENVIRFDSDDIMTPNLVKEVFNNKKDNDIIMLGYVDIKDKKIDSKLCVAGGIIYFKKSIMDNIVGGYQPWKCAADSELMVRLMNKVKIMQLKKILFYRRIHDNSLTKRLDTGHNSIIRNQYTKQIKPHYEDSEIKIERIVNKILNETDNLISVNDYFDHVYCLNLDRQEYKWLFIKNKFDNLNITVERFSAIDGDNIDNEILKKHSKINKYAIGCMLSHYNIIKDAKKNGYEKILIFEDDVIFHKNFNINFSNVIKNINEWKLLHIGASQYDWNEIVFLKNYYYSNCTQGTFGIALHNSIYDEILNTEDVINLPIDAKLFEIQKKYYKQCYTFCPNLVIADVSHSTIRNKRDLKIHGDRMKWNINLYDIKKIKILLLADVPNWAFDNIANAIIRYNVYSCLEYEIHYTHTEDYMKKFNYNDWDYVYVFFEGRTDIPQNNIKLIRGCYSELWNESDTITSEILSKNFNNCRSIIYANDKLKNILSPYNPNIKSYVISDASDPEFFYPINTQKNKDFTVLFVGNINRKIKRFDVIKRICEAAGVKLEIATNIPNTELYKLYNSVDLTINFSISEGGPQTLFESSLCETPMLINSEIPMSEKIPCFIASNEEEMINTLLYLKNNREECKLMGKKARTVVLEKYTYEKVSKYFGDIFYNLAKEDGLFNSITAFVISIGKNPNFNDCISALKNQTLPCKIEIIKNYAPSSKAFQEMINRCKTKYYIQVDEDMILYPNAIEIMYNSIIKSNNKVAVVSHMLHDVHLNFNLIGIKIYNHNITKKYSYNTDINSIEIPSINIISKLQKDGYEYVPYDTIIGDHSPKWTEEMIFERYFDLMEKYKIYKYDWLEFLPNKLEKMYNDDPTDLNYYALMGAKTSISTSDISNKQKNYSVVNNNFLKVKKEKEILNINNYITLFVISSGKNPNFNDCISALKNQTLPCKIEIIKNYAPMSKAFQEMINRCKTKYYIQVDEDMILYPNAIEKMYNAIIKTTSEVCMVTHMLNDVHLNFKISGVKIYKYDIFKKYPYNLNVISCEREQTDRMKNDGYTIQNVDEIIGDHSPKWTEEMIFERYFDLMEKYKIYKYDWLEFLPNKLEKMYNDDPTDLNYYALMGAKTSISTSDVRNREKNFKIKDSNFLKIKKEYDKNKKI